VLEYGQAIKDLAATNIFPGDLFLKNFGVTRHGRVVFYDYDELVLLEQCNFRVIPESRDAYDDFGDGPAVVLGRRERCLPGRVSLLPGLDSAPARSILRAHSELFDANWWRTMQARIRAPAR
jgi:isocitrate dehydrogenase kinase/phosphatase